MAESEFNKTIVQAGDAKAQWFDTEILPKVQENYRLHLTCIRNLIDTFSKRSLIIPDPYKNDKKISDVAPIDTSEFNENERQMVLGTRLSDYDNMIDFISNYMRFSVEQIDMPKIKKLIEVNSTFNWANMTLNSAKANTRFFATALNEIKNGANQMQLSMLKDTTTKATSAMGEINESLKKLAEFQREYYKIEVRKNILANPNFPWDKASISTATFIAEIKKMYPSAMGKKSFSAELVTEIANEELAPNKEELQKNLMKLLEVVQKKKEVQKNTVSTHDILMDAIRNLGTAYEPYNLIAEKLTTNHEVLQNEKNTLKQKLVTAIRKLLGMEELEVFYEIVLVDKRTDVKQKEKINFKDFMEKLNRRTKFYCSFSVKGTPGFNKISAQEENATLDFLTKHIAENSKLANQLQAFDEFFKTTASAADKPKIRGISMELTTLKNIFIKVNQIRAEYTAYVEEAEQMKRLGI